MRPRRGASNPKQRRATPAVLPQVIVTIDHAGHARITVDGIVQAGVEGSEEPIGRQGLGAALACVAEQAGGPVRVEVREPNGSRYADILQPHLNSGDPPDPCDATPPTQDVLEGDGFLPGEPVLVAVVATTMHADRDGTVRLPASPAVPGHVDELILFGTNSGTILYDTATRSDERSRS